MPVPYAPRGAGLFLCGAGLFPWFTRARGYQIPLGFATA